MGQCTECNYLYATVAKDKRPSNEEIVKNHCLNHYRGYRDKLNIVCLECFNCYKTLQQYELHCRSHHDTPAARSNPNREQLVSQNTRPPLLPICSTEELDEDSDIVVSLESFDELKERSLKGKDPLKEWGISADLIIKEASAQSKLWPRVRWDEIARKHGNQKLRRLLFVEGVSAAEHLQKILGQEYPLHPLLQKRFPGISGMRRVDLGEMYNWGIESPEIVLELYRKSKMATGSVNFGELGSRVGNQKFRAMKNRGQCIKSILLTYFLPIVGLDLVPLDVLAKIQRYNPSLFPPEIRDLSNLISSSSPTGNNTVVPATAPAVSSSPSSPSSSSSASSTTSSNAEESNNTSSVAVNAAEPLVGRKRKPGEHSERRALKRIRISNGEGLVMQQRAAT